MKLSWLLCLYANALLANEHERVEPRSLLAIKSRETAERKANIGVWTGSTYYTPSPTPPPTPDSNVFRSPLGVLATGTNGFPAAAMNDKISTATAGQQVMSYQKSWSNRIADRAGAVVGQNNEVGGMVKTSKARQLALARSMKQYIRVMQKGLKGLKRRQWKSKGKNGKQYESEIGAWYPSLNVSITSSLEMVDELNKWIQNKRDYLMETTNADQDDLAERIKLVQKVNRHKAKSGDESETIRTKAARKYVIDLSAKAKGWLKKTKAAEEFIQKESLLLMQTQTANNVARKKFAGDTYKEIANNHEVTIDEFADRAAHDDRHVGAEYATGEEEIDVKAIKMEKTIHAEGRKFAKQAAALFGRLASYGENIETSNDLLQAKLQSEGSASDQMRDDYTFGMEEFGNVKKALIEKIDLSRKVNKATMAATNAKDLDQAKMHAQLDSNGVIAHSAEQFSQVAQEVKGKADRVFDDSTKLKEEFTATTVTVGENFDRTTAQDEVLVKETMPNLLTNVKGVVTGAESFVHDLSVATAESNLRLENTTIAVGDWAEPQINKIIDDYRPSIKAKKNVAVGSMESAEPGATSVASSDYNTFIAENQLLETDIKEAGRGRAKTISLGGKKVQEALDRTGTLANAIVPSIKNYAKNKATGVLDGLNQIEGDLKETTLGLVDMAGKAEQVDGAQMLVDASKIAEAVNKDLEKEGERQASELDTTQTAVQAKHAAATASIDSVVKGFQETLKNSQMVAKQSADDLESMQRRTAATHEVASQSVAGHAQAFNDEIAYSQEAAGKATVSETNSHQKLWQKLQRTLVETVNEAVSKTATDAESASSDATKKTRDLDHATSGRFKDAMTNLQGLWASLKGVSANETEWQQKLQDQLISATGQAHKNAILNAQTDIETQAAIDKKFREIQSVMEEDIQGLSKDKQEALKVLAAEAKAQTEALMLNDQFTQEQQEARMHKIDVWMAGQMEAIHETDAQSQADLESGKTTSIDLIKDAKKRAADLAKELSKEDAALGIEKDNNEMRTTQGKLLQLIAHVDEQSTRFGDAFKQDIDLAGLQHEQDAKNMRTDADDTQRNSGGVLDKAATTVTDLVSSMQSTSQDTKRQITAAAAKVLTFEAEADHGLTTMTDRVGKVTTAREHRLQFVGKWADDMGVEAANHIYKVASVLFEMLTATTKQHDMNSDTIAKMAETLAIHLASEDIQTFKKISASDDTLMSMNKKNEELETWVSHWDNHTKTWEGDVMDGIRDLAKELQETEEEVNEGATQFNKALSETGNKAKHNIEEKMVKVNGEEEDALAKAEASEANSVATAEKVLAENAKEADEATDRIDKDVDEADKNGEGGVSKERADMDAAEKRTNEIRAEQGRAFRASQEVMGKTQAEYDEARGKLMGKIDEVGKALGEPIAPETMLEMDGTDVDDLRENVGLNAEHKKLAAEMDSLRKEVEQSVVS